MTKKKGKLYVTLAINFTYDTDRTTLEDATYLAKDLAIEPNYNTIVNGVALTSVKIEEDYDL